MGSSDERSIAAPGARRAVAFICAALLGALPLPAGAQDQDTREAAIVAEQAEKAKDLKPYEPSAAERLLARVQTGLIDGPPGFFPYYGSVYNGGGFTLGAGYRVFAGDRTNWVVQGLYSIRNYKLIETAFTSPGHAAGRVGFRTVLGWRDATQVAFHGLGMATPTEIPSEYRFQQTYAGGEATLHLARVVVLRGGLFYEDFRLKEPTGDIPFVEDVFTPATAPGAGLDPAFVHTTASAGIDSRPAEGYTRQGGLYQVTLHHYDDRGGDTSFNLLHTELVQHVPILRETWVVSLRGEVQSVLDGGNPAYFLMPTLGDGSSLRAYTSFRYRDRNSALVSAELRWIPNRLGLDMALFYDTGMVAPRLGDIDVNAFKSDYGVGIRFHGPTSTILRVDLARGSEGTRLVFAASPTF